MSTPKSRAIDLEQKTLDGIAAHSLCSLEELYAAHGVRAYSLAIRLTGNAQIADSVIEAVFLTVWRKAASHRLNETSITGWLAALVEYYSRTSTQGQDSVGTSPVRSDRRGRPTSLST